DPRYHPEAVVPRSRNGNFPGRAGRQYRLCAKCDSDCGKRDRQYVGRSKQYPVGTSRTLHSAEQKQSLAAILSARHTSGNEPRSKGRVLFFAFQAASFSSSDRIAVPIPDVETTSVPSDLISAVRKPLANAAEIACSIHSACLPRL